MNRLRAFSFLLFGAGSSMVFGQLPTVDITWAMLPTDQIEVRMRPDGNFSSLFSSSVFTVRWLDSGEQGLGAVQQDPPYGLCVPSVKSGPEVVSGIYRYQVFFGGSIISFADAELAWEGEQEYVVARINILSGSAFEIVNDSWTGELVNNGDFYVSLEGQDRTGEIYTFFTDVAVGEAGANGFTIAPNPAAGHTQVSVSLQEAQRNAEFVLRDMAGRIMRSFRRDLPAGEQSFTLDLVGLASGPYTLEVIAPMGRMTQRLVVNATK
ncbi:MAG: T9SS type A sorting domain-containing protein [Flavobacteriales bacterium]|nr:T9SS type A sorting domain-containing protein [Flavobacteriales bacterium]